MFIIYRQITCNAADDKFSMKNGSTPRNQVKIDLDDKYLSHDIVKQVETWMKNQRFSEQYAPSTHRSQYSPGLPSERSRKRRKKKTSHKDGDSMMESSESEYISTAESKQSHRRLFEPRDRKVPFSSGIKPPQTTKLNPGLKREQFNRSFERLPNNNTRFGSIHDELEFRKRYKRISDLKNHLQFVNGSYLSGKNIIAEERKLAPTTNFKKYRNLESSDMFAISPIEKHDRTKKSIPINQSVETAPLIKSNFNVRPQIWQKFNKLPNITPEIPSPKKSLSESNVKLDEESERGDFSGRGDISGRGTSKTGGYASTALQSQDDSKDERSRSVVTNSSYGPYQEMKVTIHIRYKKSNPTPELNTTDDEDTYTDTSSVRSLDDNDPHAFDGRIHAINEATRSIKQNRHAMMARNEVISEIPLLRDVSRTSNSSRKSKEQYPPYESGTLPSIFINDPVSKTPRLTTGKMNE